MRGGAAGGEGGAGECVGGLRGGGEVRFRHFRVNKQSSIFDAINDASNRGATASEAASEAASVQRSRRRSEVVDAPALGQTRCDAPNGKRGNCATQKSMGVGGAATCWRS